MEVLEAHTPLKLEEEGVKGLEEWFLKEVTTNLARSEGSGFQADVRSFAKSVQQQGAW